MSALYICPRYRYYRGKILVVPITAGLPRYYRCTHYRAALYLRQQLSTMQQFGTSMFHMVVHWHKLCEVENECTWHNFVVLAINMPKILKLVKIWQSYDKNHFDCFFLRHGVWTKLTTRLNYRQQSPTGRHPILLNIPVYSCLIDWRQTVWLTFNRRWKKTFFTLLCFYVFNFFLFFQRFLFEKKHLLNFENSIKNVKKALLKPLKQISGL